MYSFFITLITIYFHLLLFYYNIPLRSICSEYPVHAARNRSGEGTIITGNVIDINKVI